MDGYKISNSHFKLGSKTHIKDFIYAKRLFQNSFYAHRFAFIVAKYLCNHFEKPGIGYPDSLTVLGYGEYSQMLVNRIERMLRPTIKNVNHDMVRDIEEPELIKGEKMLEKVVIVVPIATTFSTSIKVESLINSMRESGLCQSEVLEPFINLILVTHKDIGSADYTNRLNEYLISEVEKPDPLYHPYKLFNWSHVDFENQQVKVFTNQSKTPNKLQKYFISIPSEWYLMEDCKLCMPTDNATRETPLLETDKASVTPELLLALPDNFKYQSFRAQDKIMINADATFNHHLDLGNRHYINYVKPLEFYKHHTEAIEKWIADRRADIELWPDVFRSRVVIISPSNQGNTYLVELINRLVFDDSATIIHYEITGDFIDNYQKFFGEVIQSADYIFYVDDFIQTGNTFRSVNDFVKTCKRKLKPRTSTVGCDGIFTLINKSDEVSYQDILDSLSYRTIEGVALNERLFAFYDLKIPGVTREFCPMCREMDKYDKLAESATLDTVRQYFVAKKAKLNPSHSPVDSAIQSDWAQYHPLVSENMPLPWIRPESRTVQLWQTFNANAFPERKYLQLILQHELNKLISTDSQLRKHLKLLSNYPLDNHQKNTELVNDLFEVISKEVWESFSVKELKKQLNPASKEILAEQCEYLILKIFTTYPLVNVKIIKQVTFTRILLELDRVTAQLMGRDNVKFNLFRYYKFLLKRAAVMGSNYLIRKETLLNLRTIYQKYPAERKDRIEALRTLRVVELETEENRLSQLITEGETEIRESGFELEKLRQLVGKEVSNKLQLDERSMIRDLTDSINGAQAALDENRPLLHYVRQAKAKIAYKESSISEFSYYFVALIKELTFKNEFKALLLEQNLNEISQNLDNQKDTDFLFLIRLMRFENTTVISDGLKIIKDSYLSDLRSSDGTLEDGLPAQVTFASKCSAPVLQKKLSERIQEALEDYRLTSFKKFLNVSTFEEWRKTEEFQVYLHMLYLMTCLSNEQEKPCDDMVLEDKTKAIIQNIYRIACYPFESDNDFPNSDDDETGAYHQDNISMGGFMAIRYKNFDQEVAKPDDIFIAQATKHSHNLLQMETDAQSLSYILMNGVSNRLSMDVHVSNEERTLYRNYFTKPRTIVEFEKITKNDNEIYWHTERGNLYPLHLDTNDAVSSLLYKDERRDIKYEFTENLHLKGDPKRWLFFRIADICESKGKIDNRGQAVIGLFNEGAEFKAERIRLLLLMRSSILSFMKTHYDTDSLTALISEKIKLKEAEKLKHGYLYYLNGLKSMAADPGALKDDAERRAYSSLYHTLVKSGPLLINTFARIDAFKVAKKEITNAFWTECEMPLENFNPAELDDRFQGVLKMICHMSGLGNDNLGESISIDKIDIKRTNLAPADMIIAFPRVLVDSLFAELAVNIKKNLPKEGSRLYFSIEDAGGDTVLIKVGNNYKFTYPRKKWLFYNKNNVRYNTNGLGLIKRMTKLLCGQYAEVRENIIDGVSFFEVSFLLKSL